MNKSLLLFAAMAMVGTSLSAQIQMLSNEIPGMPRLLDHQQTTLHAAAVAATPEGDAKDYTFTALAAASASYSSLIQIIENGDKLYISNLLPYVLSDSDIDNWVEGTIDREAGVVTIAPQHIGTYQGYDITLGSYAAEPGEVTLTINADGSYSNNSQYVAAFAYTGGTLAGLLNYSFNVSLTPGDSTPKVVELPEGFTPQPYVYHYHDLYNAEYTKVYEVAIEGNDVWFSGLVPQFGEAWIHGTLADGIVSIDLGQYIGQTGMYQLYTGAYSFGHGFTNPAQANEYQLVYDAETGIFTSYETEDKLWALMQQTANKANWSYNFTFTISPLAEPTYGVPANPTEVAISGNTSSENMNYLHFKSSLINAVGQYFDPASLYYRCYLDEEVYTFEAGEYSTIEEDTELIPWGLNDLKDFWMSRDVTYINFHESMFETLGIQIVYLFEGVEYCSDILNVDVEGNVTVTEVQNEFPVAIATVEQQKAFDRIFNLSGQRISSLQSGFNIVGGKVILK